MLSLSDRCIILSPSYLSYDKRLDCNGTTTRVPKVVHELRRTVPGERHCGEMEIGDGPAQFPQLGALRARQTNCRASERETNEKHFIKSPVVRIMSTKRMFCVSTAATAAAVSMWRRRLCSQEVIRYTCPTKTMKNDQKKKWTHRVICFVYSQEGPVRLYPYNSMPLRW